AFREQAVEMITSSRAAAAMENSLFRTFMFLFKASSRIIKIGLKSCLVSARVRRCDGFFHMAFRLLWQWTHPAAGQDPETKVFIPPVTDKNAFLDHCMVKAPVRMILDHAQKLLPPRVVWKLFLMVLGDLV